MPVSAPPQPLSANLRVQCRALASSARDPWEDEAEFLAEWLAQPGPGLVVNIHPVPRDSRVWGTAIDQGLSARAENHRGHPLDEATRSEFESRLGLDLGDIRIHDDSGARELAQSLGAEAFTLGKDIFTTRPDRALLAHEVIHSVQQSEGPRARRIQRKISRSTSELDPKVDELIKAHLENPNIQYKLPEHKTVSADLTKIAASLRAAGSWWNEWRKSIEPTTPGGPVAASDVLAKTREARDKIYKEYLKDDKTGSPIINAVAGLLTDYLRRNDEIEAAALAVQLFPWAKTYLPSERVGDELMKSTVLPEIAEAALSQVQFAHGSLKDIWPGSIKQAFKAFLRLPPIDEYDKARETVVAKLEAPLPSTSFLSFPAKADLFTATIDTSVEPSFNELSDIAPQIVEIARSRMADQLRTIQKEITDNRMTAEPVSPVQGWMNMVANMKTWNSGLLSEKSTMFHAISKALAPILDEEAAFWETARQRADFSSNEFQDLIASRMAELDLPLAEGMLRASPRLLALVDAIGPRFEAAVRTYLDLRPANEITDNPSRRNMRWLFASHAAKATDFADFLEDVIEPEILTALEKARSAAGGAATSAVVSEAEALAWFAARIQNFAITLRQISASGTTPTELLGQINRRHNLAAAINEFANEASGLAAIEREKAAAEAAAAAKTTPGQSAQAASDSAAKAPTPSTPPKSAQTGVTKAGGTTPQSFEKRPGAAPWAKVAARTGETLARKDVQTGLFIMPSAPEKSSDSSIFRLDSDFGELNRSRPILGLEPFTLEDVQYLLHRNYYRDLLRAMGPELVEAAKQGANRTMEDLWISGRTITKAEESSGAPERFVASGAVRYLYDNDPAGSFLELLRQDPVFDPWSKSIGSSRTWVTNLGWNHDMGPLWIWVYPKPYELVASLHQIPTLRGIVKLLRERQIDTFTAIRTAKLDDEGKPVMKYSATEKTLELAAKVGEKVPAAISDDEAYAWYQELRNLANSEQILGAGGKDDPEAFKKLRAEIASGHKAAGAAVKADELRHRILAREALRRATTLDRAVVRDVVLNQLKRYDAGDLRTEHILSTALENIEVFRRSVQPNTPREVALQTAALMVDLAGEMRRIYGPNTFLGVFTTIDLPLGYNVSRAYRFMHEARAYLDALKVQKPKRGPKDPPADTEEHSIEVYLREGEEPTSIDAKLTDTRDFLTASITPMEDELYARQWQFGITGLAGEQTLTSHLGGRSLRSAKAIAAENKTKQPDETPEPETFRLHGIDIRISEILTDFIYLPGTGVRNEALGPGGEHAYYAKGRLYLGRNSIDKDTWEDPAKRRSVSAHTVEPLPPPGTMPPAVDLVSVQLFSGSEPISEPFNITSHHLAGDQPALVWLAGVVHDKVIADKFAQLAADIQLFVEAMKFVISLHPVGRYAVMAADALEMLVQLTNDPDFLKELTAITTDPMKALEKVADALAQRFTVDGMFDLLLNGNFDAPDFANRATVKGKRSASLDPKAKGGKVQRLLARVKRIGVVTAMRLESFQDKVQRPVHSIEAGMARHPRFGTLIAWLGDHAAAVLSGNTDALVGLVLKHPIVGPILEAYLLFEERKRMKLGEDPSTSFIKSLGDASRSFTEPFENALENASEFELPSEILPLDLAVSALLDVLIALAQKPKNAKVKAAAKVVKELKEGSDKLGLTSYATRYLAGKIRESKVDPNNYWRDHLLPRLKDPIESTIHSAADQIGGMMTKMPVIGPIMQEHRVDPPSASGIKAEVKSNPELDSLFESEATTKYLQGLKLADTEEGESGPSTAALRALPDVALQSLKPKPGQSGTPTSPGAPAGGSPHLSPTQGDLATAKGIVGNSHLKSDGKPLPPSVRKSAEQRFGHDFHHVRLSQGPAAISATAGQGADAVTTGSHIHMRPDLSPNSGRGARVLDHELAHVLQKTTPIPSRAGRGSAAPGLRIRSHEEAAADRMASRAANNPSGQPVPVQGAHHEGSSPSISADLLKSFLRKVSDPASGAKLVAAVEKAHGPDREGPDGLDPKVEEEADKIWKNLMGVIQSAKIPGAPSYLTNATTQKTIKAHLEKRLKWVSDLSAAKNIVGHLALNRQLTEIHEGKPPKKSLQTAGFLDDVALYITGRSGVVLNITNKAIVAKSSSVMPTLEFAHIELHLVRATEPESDQLWEKAIQNTWTKEFPAGTQASSAKEYKKFQDAVASLLASEFGSAVPPSATEGNPGSGTALAPAGSGSTAGSPLATYSRAWASGSKDLQFNDEFKRRAEERMHPPSLEFRFMPPWPVYAAVGRTETGMKSIERAKTIMDSTNAAVAAGDRPRAAAIGLHLGTHRDFTNTNQADFQLEKNARNSHHITQYLLPEYFRNNKGFQPFPFPGATYPGVKFDAKSAVTTIQDPSAPGSAIDVAMTSNPERGQNMPAINLSEMAHHNSDLHVSPAPDDLGQASQGAAIHQEFQSNLQKRTGKASAVEADAYVRAHSTEPPVGHALFQAVQDTYSWIWNDKMKDALRGKMPAKEVQFYLDQFPSDKPDSVQHLKDLHSGTPPAANTMQADVLKRADEAIVQMTAGMAKLGWKLP